MFTSTKARRAATNSVAKNARRAAAATAVTGAVFVGGIVAANPAEAWEVAVWDRVAMCESSGNWSINTGNGYYGGLQFSASTWRAYGGTAYASYAHQATKAQQIAIARRTLYAQGPGAWPVCSVRAGLTKTNGGADPNAMPTDGSGSTGGGSTTVGKLTVDGIMGPNTTKAMQRWVGTTADGIWGRATTRALQAKVGARVDGVRGPETYRKTQAKIGAPQTGVWDSTTVRQLQTYLNQIAV